MTAKWLILISGRPRETTALYDAVERSGREVKCLPDLPAPADSVYPAGDCVVLHGPMDLVAAALRTRVWTPTAWADPGAFACRGYYGHWGRYLLQQDYAMLPLGEVRRRRDWLFETLASDGALFIRPDANDKSFDGGSVTAADFESWSQQLAHRAVDPATLCVAARPVAVGTEWRLVVRRGRVVTGSSYRVGGAVNTTARPTPEVVAFGESVAAHPFPGLPNVYAMDVCAAGERLAVVEVGPINSVGYYGCDLDAVVDAVSREAEQDWNDAGPTVGP